MSSDFVVLTAGESILRLPSCPAGKSSHSPFLTSLQVGILMLAGALHLVLTSRSSSLVAHSRTLSCQRGWLVSIHSGLGSLAMSGSLQAVSFFFSCKILNIKVRLYSI